MVWFKVDDSLASHSKPRAARLEAMGLWSMAGSWSAGQLQDGRVAEWYVETWPRGRTLAARLVRAGLWHAPGHDCPDCPQIDEGWIFHQFQERNPSAEQVKADRAAAAERQRRAREAAKLKHNGVRHAVTALVTDAEQTANSRRESRSPRPDRREGSGTDERGALRSVPRDTATPPDDEFEPADRCAAHAGDPHPPPCGRCQQARFAAEAWREQRDRRLAEEAVEQRRRDAELRAEEARRCDLCDDDGYLPSGRLCTHDPEQADRNHRGAEAAKAALANRQKAEKS